MTDLSKILTEKEINDTTLVILDDGRKIWLPTVVHSEIRESAFWHGIEWANAHTPAKLK
jgi:hypothetical protein